MRILLVDDETSVIQALLAVLKTLPGHDVRVATSGEKALENASAMGGVDLLITDVVMDPMDGFTLRDQMVSRYPNVRTIVISGYDLSDYPEQTAHHQCLQKPVDSHALVAAVQAEAAALAAAQAAPKPVATAVRAVPAVKAGPPGIQPPRAVPATAVPSVKAVPAAQPRVAAVPKAVAAAPSAVPAAQPRAIAVPKAVPSAAPAPVAVPQARAAAPVAVPKAVPAASPAPQAPAAPASPAGVARPHANNAVLPPDDIGDIFKRATPAAPEGEPASEPESAMPAAPVFQVASAPGPMASGESLMGQMLGAYQIVSYLGEGRVGSAYAAVQVSINRPVGLKVLDPERAQDPAAKARFIADARAKAHVQHPSILAVYEAGESDGRIFFAREYVDGQSLAEIAASGRQLDEPQALRILKAVADGFVYLQVNNIPHRPLDATKVYLGADGQPRLANIAVQVADEVLTPEQEIHLLGRIVRPLVPAEPMTPPGINVLLKRMIQAQSSGLNAWGAVLQAVKALEPKNAPVEAMKISAQDRAAIEAVEIARKQKRRSFWINVASISTLFCIVVWLALKKFVFTNERKIQRTVKIAAGTYRLPDGRDVSIEKDFWIDKYEVTWGQYARFLDYLDKNPTADQDFRHPRMPRYLEHRPQYWDIYYSQARVNGKARKIPIDLNCPVMEVTWWDAYAYAKWLGRETGTERDLPTEEEWAVACAGDKAYKYPWGNEPDNERANTKSDYVPMQPGAKGKVDGYNHWNPVDAIRGDRSTFGVVGLAGNVAEWTSTWTEDGRFPLVKGGSFQSGLLPSDESIGDLSPDKGLEWIGFRTISRSQTTDSE